MVDHGREGHRQGDTNQEYHRDDGNGAFAEAEDVCEQRSPARGPAREGVRQDRPQHEEYGPAYPHAAKARDGGLASYQRVAFDLHVQEELNAYADHGEPHESYSHLSGYIGPQYQLAGAERRGKDNDARPHVVA